MRTSIAIIEREGERSENHIKKLWLAFQAADVERTQRGLEFGKAMCELRVIHKRVSGETRSTPGFEGVCDRLEIPRATAYRCGWNVTKCPSGNVSRRPIVSPTQPPILRRLLGR